MTLGLAWIRKPTSGDELWFASDSRLTGDGNIWDECPKLLTTPRRDTVLAFSGSTFQAYPLMVQIRSSIESYLAASDGSLEYFDLLGHLERVVNGMLERIERDRSLSWLKEEDGNRPEFSKGGDSLAVSGYSRLHGSLAFRILNYFGNETGWRFSRASPKKVLGGRRLIGCWGDHASVGRFWYHLKKRLEEASIQELETVDMEPLETLNFMLSLPVSNAVKLPTNRRPEKIGGPPQVVRTLAGAQATPLAVRWRTRGDAVVDSLLGRTVLPYENLGTPLVDLSNSGYRIHASGRWPSPD